MTITLDRPDVTGHAVRSPGRPTTSDPAVLVVDDAPRLASSLSFALHLLGLAEPWRDDDSVSATRLIERIAIHEVGAVVVDLVDHRKRLILIRAARLAGARVLVIVPRRGQTHEEEEARAAGAEAILVKAGPRDRLACDLYVSIVRRDPTQQAGTHVARSRFSRPNRGASAFDALGSLSPREGEVLRRLMSGRTVERIAADVGLSIATVRSHVRAIHTKLGVNCQLAAVALAYGAGWSIDD